MTLTLPLLVFYSFLWFWLKSLVLKMAQFFPWEKKSEFNRSSLVSCTFSVQFHQLSFSPQPIVKSHIYWRQGSQLSTVNNRDKQIASLSSGGVSLNYFIGVGSCSWLGAERCRTAVLWEGSKERGCAPLPFRIFWNIWGSTDANKKMWTKITANCWRFSQR